MSSGLFTGAQIVTQMAAIFGEEFASRYVIQASGVAVSGLQGVRERIGVTKDGSVSDNYNLIVKNDDVFNDEAEEQQADAAHHHKAPWKLHVEILKLLGLGNALGCPAGWRASQETEDFLIKECDVDPKKVKRTMLGNFAERVVAQYEHYVGEPCKVFLGGGNALEGRIQREASRIISGDVLRERPVAGDIEDPLIQVQQEPQS